MPGWLTNGLPTVAALVQNGVTLSPVPQTQLYANMLIPVDTETASGVTPQSVAATTFQVIAQAVQLIQNTATHTATLNTKAGLMLTENLTTAVGASYTFQLVNSLITSATSPAPQIQFHPITDTQAVFNIASITNAAGTSTVVFTNVGTAAANGTWALGFHI